MIFPEMSIDRRSLTFDQRYYIPFSSDDRTIIPSNPQVILNKSPFIASNPNIFAWSPPFVVRPSPNYGGRYQRWRHGLASVEVPQIIQVITNQTMTGLLEPMAFGYPLFLETPEWNELFTRRRQSDFAVVCTLKPLARMGVLCQWLSCELRQS